MSNRYCIYRNTRLQKSFLGVAPIELLPLWIGIAVALALFFSNVAYGSLLAAMSIITGFMLSKLYHSYRSKTLPRALEAFLYRMGYGVYGRGLDGKNKIFSGRTHQRHYARSEKRVELTNPTELTEPAEAVELIGVPASSATDVDFQEKR